MGKGKRPLHARSGMIARACQLAGAGVLTMGVALAVPALMASAPAGAQPQEFPTYNGTPGDPVLQTVDPSANCEHQIGQSLRAHDENGFTGCATLTVNKVDSVTGKGIAGAGFTLYEAEVNLGNGTFICGTPTYSVSSEVLTDSTGAATFSVPAFEGSDNAYAVCAVETTTPAGYSAATPPSAAVFVVSDDSTKWVEDTRTPYCKTVSQLFDNAVAQTDTEVDHVCASPPVTISNDPIPTNINISKYGTNNTGLNGATFTLESGGSPVSTGPTGVVNGSASCITAGGTSTAAATCSILNIQIAGTYQLVETSAPAGYNTVPPIPVTVSLGTPPIQVIVVDTATVVPTAPSGGTSTPATAAVSGATTVHTGEPFAGSAPYVLTVAGLGAALMGFGIVRRRRLGSNA